MLQSYSWFLPPDACFRRRDISHYFPWTILVSSLLRTFTTVVFFTKAKAATGDSKIEHSQSGNQFTDQTA